MTDQVRTSPENMALLWTAGVAEHAFENYHGSVDDLGRARSADDRRFFRAHQRLVQALYRSDLLICCRAGQPASVPGLTRRIIVAASDQEAADAYIAEVAPRWDAGFAPASTVTGGASALGSWRARRLAWLHLLDETKAGAIVVNPAGPHRAIIVRQVLNRALAARLGDPDLPPDDVFRQISQRAAGREQTRAVIAALRSGARARPPVVAQHDGAERLSAWDPLFGVALMQLDARTDIDHGEFERGGRRFVGALSTVRRLGAPEWCIDGVLEILPRMLERSEVGPDVPRETLQLCRALLEIAQSLDCSWKRVELDELAGRTKVVFGTVSGADDRRHH